MAELHEPDNYFDRLDELFLGEKIDLGNNNLSDYWRRRPWLRARKQVKDLSLALGLLARLMLHVPDTRLRRHYRRRALHLLLRRRRASVFRYYVIKCAMHYHAYTMVQSFLSGRKEVVNSF
jgi:hypothetical protein